MIVLNSADRYAKRTHLVPIKAVSAGIRLNPRKLNSPQMIRDRSLFIGITNLYNVCEVPWGIS